MNARFWKSILNEGKVTLDRFRNIFFRQQLWTFKEFYMETRLPNTFKTTNLTNLTKVIQESSYRVLQVTSK